MNSLAGMASATLAVAESSTPAARVGQPGGHLQGLDQRRGALRWAGSRPAPRAAGRRLSVNGLLDPGAVGEADHHRHVARAHLVDQLAGPPLGLVQPRGRHVGGLHAGRVVDQEDEPRCRQAASPCQPGRSRASDRQGQRSAIAAAAAGSAAAAARCALTCRSSIDLCHRYVLGTSSGRRSQLEEVQQPRSPAEPPPGPATATSEHRMKHVGKSSCGHRIQRPTSPPRAQVAADQIVDGHFVAGQQVDHAAAGAELPGRSTKAASVCL